MIKASHTYYTGHQDCPALKFVVEVTSAHVWFVLADGGELTNSSLRAFTADAETGGRAMARKPGPYAAQAAARHGAKATASDLDTIRATITWPKELDEAARRNPRQEDGYGLAKSFGVAGSWHQAERKTTVDLPRSNLEKLTEAGLIVVSVEILWACPTSAKEAIDRQNAATKRARADIERIESDRLRALMRSY